VLAIGLTGAIWGAVSQVHAEDSSFHRFWPDNLFAVAFPSETLGFVAGYGGSVLRTKDAGETWEASYIGRNELIRRISFVDENTGWAVGHRGSIFFTEDGGDSWIVQKEIAGIYLRDVSFVDRNNGWVVGHEANIWNTKDGGKSWQKQKLLGFEGRDLPRLHGVFAKDNNSALLVGEFGVIGHTENGGDHWLISPIDISVTWLAIDGNDEVAYVVGLDGNAVRLTLATDDERLEIVARVSKKRALKEARERAKAIRLGREYTGSTYGGIPASEIEYSVTPIVSQTGEHLLDVDMGGNGEALIVGRSTLIKARGLNTEMLTAGAGFPLGFIWLGGIDVLPGGEFWASGIRGLVVSGDFEKQSYDEAFNLAASGKIRLISSRWGEN